MNLVLRELANKAAWLSLLSEVFRDARVRSSGRWDVRAMAYELSVERIAYEAACSIGQDGPEIWEYPYVRSLVRIEPVTSCVDRRDRVASRWEGELVKAFDVVERHRLHLVTSYGTTDLSLGGDARIEACDVGPPSSSRTTCDYGRPAVNLDRAKQLIRARAV